MPDNVKLASGAGGQLRFRLPDETDFHGPLIKVFGVGGGGGNAVRHMVREGITGVEFIAANTDAQALCLVPDSVQKIQLGQATTRGLGAGSVPEIGAQAALESEEQLVESLTGANLVFVAAGMGGGTGTGAVPVICRLAKDRRILTVAVVTKPFSFEQSERMVVAEKGIEELRKHVDSLIVVPNDKLLSELGDDVLLFESFNAADEVLSGAVRGISDLVNRVGHINLDFADIKTVMSESGMAVIASCTASGQDRALVATERALQSPLLEDVDLGTARAALINVYSDPYKLKGSEYKEVGESIRAHLSDRIVPVIGLVAEESLADAMRVTVVVTGIEPTMQADMPPQRSETQRGFVPSDRSKEDRDSFDPREHAWRKKQIRGSASVSDSDYVDVPSFLKNQAE